MQRESETLMESGVTRAVLWLGGRFPPDGRGLFAPETEFGEAIRAACDSFWDGRVPRWARWAAVVASGCAWGMFAPLVARRYSRVRNLSPGDFWRLVWTCLRSGRQPNEVWIWSHCFPGRGLHPLPARTASALFTWLGAGECREVLSDKVASARMLEAAGLRTPKIVRVIARGSVPVLGAEFFGSQYSDLFVKPRHGSAGRGTLSVDVFGQGRFSINGGEPVGAEDLAARLAAGAVTDDLVVQERLTGCPELADLSAGGAPVLRVTTAREPGAAPFLHSALLAIPVPGENPVDFLNGQVWAAVDPKSGVLGYGIRFAEPGESDRSSLLELSAAEWTDTTVVCAVHRSCAGGNEAGAGDPASCVGHDPHIRRPEHSGKQFVRKLDTDQTAFPARDRGGIAKDK